MEEREALLLSEWHPTKNGELSLSDAGVSKKFWWKGSSCGHEWESNIHERRNRNSGCPVCAGKRIVIGFNDLESQNPTLAAEWHPTLNGELLPTMITPRSSARKIWWLCEKGHEWEAKPLHRASGSGCPFCSKKKNLLGFNDLLTINPKLAAEWHPTKNGELDIKSIFASSRLNVWWLGDCGHEWESRVCNRVQSGTGCHFCSGFEILVGFNDLNTTHSHLSSEWHPTKNGELEPTKILKSSHKKVWWKCNKGHEWQSSANSRANGSKCPTCNKTILVKNVNDLESQNPTVASEWHPTKNGDLKPSDCFKSSSKKVWWLCDCGHEWEAKIANRNHGAGCPVCGLKRGAQKHATARFGENDFATANPEFSLEWHPTKNTRKPYEVVKGSTYRASWICVKGHEWEAAVSDRNFHKTGCPVCSLHIYVSKPEKELYAFLTNLGLKVEQSNRSVLGKSKEIDLYLPDKKFGIEYNGVYWHDENHKERSYHYDKYVSAQKAGIQLVQIWEDDWTVRKDLILKTLAYKLGVSNSFKIFARKTSVHVVDTLDAKVFLNENHIQGFGSGSYYVGLKDSKDVLVALMVLKKEPGSGGKRLGIVRYATSVQVVGGFSKLLKFAEITYSPNSFVTFSDNMISDGGLYENNGFVVDKLLPPDYMYVVKNVRVHKFGYRLKRFKNDPDLQWVEGLTERELAVLNNIPRVWDAGKVRWVKEVVG